MLDNYIRPYISPSLKIFAKPLMESGFTPNQVTIVGAALALPCFLSLWLGFYGWALLFMLANRLTDGLDGTLARALDKKKETGVTDFGGYLDIVTDFIFYAGFIFFFALGKPEYMFFSAFLLFSFMGTSSTFLAYAILAEKHKMTTEIEGQSKTMYYLGGLTEGTETIICFTLMCLMAPLFPVIAVVFGMLCWFTTATRIMAAFRNFK